MALLVIKFFPQLLSKFFCSCPCPHLIPTTQQKYTGKNVVIKLGFRGISNEYVTIFSVLMLRFS